ncbi:MAG: magnesium chelatase subunit D, partial [Beijerinckiaceae bacterium]
RQSCDVWSDALVAAAAIAVDRAGLGGVVLRAPAGEVRLAGVGYLRSSFAEAGGGPWVQVPADVSDHQLLGGLDLERTLAEGRTVAAAGALARADGGLLTIAMAERLQPSSAAIMAGRLDGGARLAIIAQDEGIGPDESPPAALAERLSIRLDLTSLTHRDLGSSFTPDVEAARRMLPKVDVPDSAVEALCAASAALGIGSDRMPLFALRLARVSAALAGASSVRDEDIALAARLVLGPRATQLPNQSPDEDTPAEPPPDDQNASEQNADPEQAKALEDKVLDAAKAAIPRDLLALLNDGARQASRHASTGKAGDAQKAGRRGRPIGSRRGELRSRARLDLLDTLRAAAPWQKLRGREAGGPLKLRPDDVRVKRFRDRQASTTIFVVDASGSAAMDRLGEAK